MLGTGNYPITIAEMPNYTRDADRCFEIEEHEALKSLLAWNPESGTVLDGTGGVRALQWPVRKTSAMPWVLYYFRDLNMPLYIIALYWRVIRLDDGLRAELKHMVDELVAHHREEWRIIIARQRRGGKESA
jgi:hypothetical protein